MFTYMTIKIKIVKPPRRKGTVLLVTSMTHLFFFRKYTNYLVLIEKYYNYFKIK